MSQGTRPTTSGSALMISDLDLRITRVTQRQALISSTAAAWS
jgi:hypothetical protein